MKEKLEKLELEYNAFLLENKEIFNKDENYKQDIEKLKNLIWQERELNKPPFPFPDLNPDSLGQISYDYDDVVITQDLIDKSKNVFYNQHLVKLIGWKVSFEDESFGAVNDGDYYDVSIELTDPLGNVYRVEDQNCMAVGFNFGDKRFE